MQKLHFLLEKNLSKCEKKIQVQLRNKVITSVIAVSIDVGHTVSKILFTCMKKINKKMKIEVEASTVVTTRAFVQEKKHSFFSTVVSHTNSVR